MWYVIQTMTGREQELVDLITDRQKAVNELINVGGQSAGDEAYKRTDDSRTRDRCFVIKREVVWRRQGECIKHTETLFPGYVFVDTESPQEL